MGSIDCKKMAIYMLNHEHRTVRIDKGARMEEVLEFIENLTCKDAYENGLRMLEVIDGVRSCWISTQTEERAREVVLRRFIAWLKKYVRESNELFVCLQIKGYL